MIDEDAGDDEMIRDRGGGGAGATVEDRRNGGK